MNGDLLKYGDYEGTVAYSAEDGALVGKVLHIDSLLMYHGESLSEIKENFESAVDGYLAYCARNNLTPNKPYKGSFNVRVGEERHKSIAAYAARNGISLNEAVGRAIDGILDQHANQTTEVHNHHVHFHMDQAHQEVSRSTAFDVNPLVVQIPSEGESNVEFRH